MHNKFVCRLLALSIHLGLEPTAVSDLGTCMQELARSMHALVDCVTFLQLLMCAAKWSITLGGEGSWLQEACSRDFSRASVDDLAGEGEHSIFVGEPGEGLR